MLHNNVKNFNEIKITIKEERKEVFNKKRKMMIWEHQEV